MNTPLYPSTAAAVIMSRSMQNQYALQPRPVVLVPAPTNSSNSRSTCIPIAPLPSTSPVSSDQMQFPASGLCPLDVLLKKGGRPTHGKKRFFQHCCNSAEEYASFKSPIDRRLLARKLVEQWLDEVGGRFCVALTTPNGHESGYFRLASTEEAMSFTRRVLVRHFTPSITSRKKNEKAKNKIDGTDSSTVKSDSSVASIGSGSCLNSPLTTATTLPLTTVLKQKENAPSSVKCTDDHLAAEAADALCFLSSVQPFYLPGPACKQENGPPKLPLWTVTSNCKTPSPAPSLVDDDKST